MQYELVVFDRIQAGFPVPRQFADVQALQQSLKRNPPCAIAPSDRLPHLAEILLERFPLEGNEEQECIWHVGEEYLEEFGDLLGDAQAAVNHAWTIISPGGDHLITLMRDLLPLLREMQLDLFDLSGGFYLCNAGKETRIWRLDNGQSFDAELYFPDKAPICAGELPPFVDRPGRPPLSLLVFDRCDWLSWNYKGLGSFSYHRNFDPDAYCEELNRRLTKDLPAVVAQLQDHQFPPTPIQRNRLQRLVFELLQRFPYPRPAAEEVWQGTWPIAQIQNQSIQAWRPLIRPERYAEFMAVLLPLARELRLDVIDVHLGAYFTHVKTPIAVPSDQQELLNQLDPSSVSWKLPTKAKMMKACHSILKPELAKAGFVPQDEDRDIYQRQIPGGYQTIKVCFSENTRQNLKYLQFRCCSYSKRRARAIALQSWVEEGKSLDGFDETCVQELEPSWLPWKVFEQDLPIVPPQKVGSLFKDGFADCHTETQAQHLAEQLIQRGLPMLDEARTVKGMLRLFTEPKWSDCFSDNLHGASPSVTESMLYYAHVVQDERIEQWTPLALQRYQEFRSSSITEADRQNWCSALLHNLASWKQYEPVDPDGVA